MVFITQGTTSAYAENTTATSKPHGLYGNYLRVRGEYKHTLALRT